MKRKLQKMKALLVVKIQRRWLTFLESLQKLYIKTGLYKVVFFIKFLFHAYDKAQIDLNHVPHNFAQIIEKEEYEWIDSSSDGRLVIVKRREDYRWFKLKNFLLFGAPQKRVEKVIYYTFMTLTLEVHNPLKIKILKDYIERKTKLLIRVLRKVRLVNGRRWGEYASIMDNIDIFRRSSLVQMRVIKGMERMVLKQKDPYVVTDVKNALKRGLHPLLVVQGLSGTYWMRGTNREIAGLFKPFDEEAFAPNNPGGPSMQGALGKRRMRPGIRVGEAAHREVAAYVVDQFFGFGIVPRTYYATFSHPTFFLAGGENAEGFLSRKLKSKMGSFQEYIEGFIILHDLPKELWGRLPEIEIQLLFLLDIIVGNCDRNTANILVAEDKIAAIDHGLCFSDLNLHLATWYWKFFEQAHKPFPPGILKLLENFPFDALETKLRKQCGIDIRAFDRLRERVTLFSEGILSGLTPFEMADVLTDENFYKIHGYKETLKEKCQEIVKQVKEK